MGLVKSLVCCTVGAYLEVRLGRSKLDLNNKGKGKAPELDLYNFKLRVNGIQ